MLVKAADPEMLSSIFQATSKPWATSLMASLLNPLVVAAVLAAALNH